VLGPGDELRDDRPVLETARRRPVAEALASELAVVATFARRAAEDDPRRGPIRLWIDAEATRARGDREAADRLASEAGRAGLALAGPKQQRRFVRDELAAAAERARDVA